MAMTSGGNQGTQAAINVTPLIDVLLVLLIIFMVIEPSSVRGLEALLPESPNAALSSKTSLPPVVVQVLADEVRGVTYKLNEVALSESELTPALSRIFAAREDKSMFLEGDARLDFAAVANVINAARVAGGGDVGIISTKTRLSR